MNKVVLVPLLGLIAACSSSPTIQVPTNVGQEKVINRIDDLSSRPSYITEQNPFKIEGGKVYALGETTGPIDSNLSALYRIAQNNAKSLISSSVEARLDYILQNAEEGITMGTSQARYIGSEVSQLTTHSIRLDHQYWEKVATVQESGQVTVSYRVFALVEIPEHDFKTAIFDAIRASQGKLGISAEFAKKVDEHWEKITGSLPQKHTEFVAEKPTAKEE